MALVFVPGASSAPATPSPAFKFTGKRTVAYNRDIRPILAENCFVCHGPDSAARKAGLRLDRFEDATAARDGGAAITPGKPEKSLFLARVLTKDPDVVMPPPTTKKQLNSAQIELLKRWVVEGAQYEPHWSFIPPARPVVPPVKDAKWVRNPVDQFVLARLEKERLRPAASADKHTLLRRVTYDLTGLPPTPAEADAFVADTSPDAYAKVVERLLASPRYGERWGRYWLDIARYSDTKGYVYGREERFWVHAHTYRDWVIRALNDDLPYDRFLLLQLAADQAAPADLKAQAAMGFLTVGRRFLGVTHDIIDDRIDAVTRGMLGLTVTCARCHDHKYDPIPTADYYSLYGVFHNTVEKLVSLDPAPARTDVYAAFEKDYLAKAKTFDDTLATRREENSARARARAGDYLAAQLNLSRFPEEGFDQILTDKDLIPAFVRRWRDHLVQREQTRDPIFGLWHYLRRAPLGDIARATTTYLAEANRTASVNALIATAFSTPAQNLADAAARYGRVFAETDAQWRAELDAARKKSGPLPVGLTAPAAEEIRRFLYDADSPSVVPGTGIANNEQFFDTGTIEALWKLRGTVDRVLIQAPGATPHALVLQDGPTEPQPRIFVRGKAASRGDEVPRQFLSVLAGPDRKPFTHGSGRLELARAIANADNPLTARVAVNRIWRHHFGAGLVRTPSDLGTRAQSPSHPELLDWLTCQFVSEGWSQKKLHRLILLSATYQQDSAETPAALAVDAENRLLTYFPRQRLDYEALRDSLLFVAGELDERQGGRPVALHTEPFGTRRSVYGLVDRQFVPGVLRVFDFANPDMHCPQRSATTVPQQSLFLLNSPFVVARARAVAAKADRDAPTGAENKVRALYRAVYQREPTRGQLGAGIEFLASPDLIALPASKPVPTEWRYGFGELNATTSRLTGFTPLPHFSGEAWQGGAGWPDPKLGWVRLTRNGGHAGNDLAHAAVRRWVAPADATVSITGTVKHEPQLGDGIRAFIVSSRLGLLGQFRLHHSQADAAVAKVEVRAGDTLDFVVDIGGTLSHDEFTWTPVIQTLMPPTARVWDAGADFGGPPAAPQQLLKPLEAYAHVLLLANEFAFVD